MDLIERLKKKKIINEDNSFNSNRDEYINPTYIYDVPDREIKRNHSDIPNYQNMKKVDAKELNKPVFDKLKDTRDTINKIKNGDYTPIRDYVLKGSLWKDVTNVASNLFLGGKQSIEQVGKYIEHTNENMNPNYKSIRRQQFLTSSKVSELDKAKVRSENDNLLLKRIGINDNDETQKIETNLIKQGIQNEIDQDQEKISSNIQETKNPILKKAAELSPTIGQMGVGMGLSAVNPALGFTFYTTSSAGSYIDDAKQRGMSDDEAFMYGNLMGLAEGGTEVIGIQKFQKAGNAMRNFVSESKKELIKEGTQEISKNILKESLKEYGIGITDNIIQEAMIEPIQELTASLVGGKDKANWSDIPQRMLRAGINGGLVSAIVGGSNLGIESCIGLTKKIRNGDNITQQEFKKAVKDAGKELDTKQMVLDSVNQQVQKYNQQINKVDSSVTNKESSQTISNSLKSLVDSAKAYNLNANDETIQSINQKLNDRGITSKFDESLFKDTSGKVKTDVNALWKTTTDENGNIKREVIFNPKADTNKTLQQVAIHEMLHDFEGSNEAVELSKLILDKNSKREGYKEARHQLEEIYSKVYDRNSENFKLLVDQEEVADTLAQKLGDQDFINSLNKEKPSVFKRVYNWIVDKLNKFTGSKNEKIYWENVKNKFESAYKQDYQGSNVESRFSIQTDNRGNKYVRVDTDQDIFEGKTIKEQTKIAQDYILNNFREKGLLKDNNSINVSRKTANEYTHPKNGLDNTTYSSKMKASTELDNLLEISQFVKSEPDDGRHIFAKNGWDYYETVFKVGNKTYSGLLNIAKGEKGKLLYDITNIKERASNYSVKTVSVANSSINNSISASNNNVNTINNNNSMQESENNSGSLNLLQNNQLNVPTKQLTENQRQNRLEYLKNIDTSNMKLLEKSKIKSEIRALENGYNSVEEMRKVEKEQEQKAIQEYNKKNNTIKDSNKSSFKSTTNTTNSSFKEQQLGIIQKTNPMLDDYHTGIRSIEDIKTFKEAYNIAKKEATDGGWNEYASYPDITNEMIEDSLKNGEITVYSSNDIKNGAFVTPSYEQALEYAGNDSSKVKSKKVKLDDVAWINLDEGQYAKISNSKIKPSIKQSGAWQLFLENQIGTTGRGKTVKELRLPTKENWKIVKNKNNINKHNEEKLERIGITKEKDIITDKKDNYTKDAEEKKIAQVLEEMPSKEKEKSRAWAIFKANVFDKGIVFEELSRKTKNRDLQGKWDYTLTANARGQNAIGKTRYEFDSETKTQKLISKSLESIREEVGDNTAEFNKYMYHQLNIDRMTLEERFGGDTGINYERKKIIKNKPVFSDEITAEMSKEIVNKYEQNNPEFKKWAKDVYDFLDANTQELVKTGVISEDTRQLFKEMYPHYVPISRVNNKGNAIAVPLDTRRTGVNSPIKRAKGGSSDIKPLFETIADRTLQTYRASARNNFGVELLNTLQTVQNAEKIDVDNIVEEIINSEDGNLLKKGQGTEPPSFTVFVNGEKVTFEISKDMYDALKPVSEGLAFKSKILNKVSNFRRGVLTEYNPVFMITNSLKDIQDVVINSQHTAKTISKLPEAYSQIILGKGYWYNEYLQNGGEQNSYFNANDGSFENNKKVSLGRNIATMPLRAISKVNNIIEMSPRLAEYIASREKGRSVETSMLDASRVTTNFKAGGDVTKFLNRNGATFLNASVQGAMQQVRNIQEAKVKGLKGWTVLACKYAVAGLPVILLNNILWKDDEDYENLQDYVKDSYYCIAKYGDGKFIRIPKGRTTATIQKIVSNINEYITGNKKLDIDNLSKDFWENLQFSMDNLAPNNPIDNNIISPIIQAVTNTSWYGEDIVPSRLQDKPVKEQYDETTDKFSKWLGEKLNISPYKINYLLDQYGGGISDVILPAITPQAENNIMEDKFTTDSVMKSRYPGEFFEKSDELNIKANSDKATDLDKVKNKYVSTISDKMSKLYKEKRKIENSSFSDKEKKEKLRAVQKEINELAQDGIEEVDKAEVKGITAKVGNELYYKYHDEWTKLSDEEKEKNKNISLESYADYKNKLYSQTKKLKDSGELEEKEQLKNAQKSEILKKSRYSEKEKIEIYKNYISTTDKKIALVEKLGFPINQYLAYKTNEFKNDKDAEGETIKGSKKEKVYDYVNSIPDKDLSQENKMLLLKIEDISDYDDEILDYILDYQGINNSDKKELLEILGFKVKSDGSITTQYFIPGEKYM